MTVLYNLETGEIIGRHNPYYTVNGERVTLDYPLVELEYIIEPKPTFNNKTQFINSQQHQIDLVNSEYRIKWTITDKDAYQLALDDWTFDDFSKRIVAPIELILDDYGVKMHGWFQINDLPIEKWSLPYTAQEPDPINPEVMLEVVRYRKMLRLYCNSILTEHQAILDMFSDTITVEDRPKKEDFN